MPLARGLTYCYRESKLKPVVFKSDTILVYMERDGMSAEDALEFWEYNMAGSDSLLIAIDDTISQMDLARTLHEQDCEEQGIEPTFEELKWNESAKQAANIQGIDLDA